MQNLTEAGQIKKGDKIHCTYNGWNFVYEAEEVLNPGTDHEEVIVDLEDNRYFITSMVLNDTSWAKDVRFKSK